ncbi:MAG: DNA mismatch repair protein MutS [Deltaproteobacteria bacterium]|nr:DNA mismatch repair protein MutS [Deltaproteobacteria bacterium]
MENLTPAMRQYLDIKTKNSDAILLFRMGDFYEMFFEDAVLASRILGIALTSRDRAKKIPMCGVPYHAADGYIARLVKAGHKVAICEQAGLPPAGDKGIVERYLKKIITPGTALEDAILDPKVENHIAAVSLGGDGCGLACMELSTGEFMVSEFTSIASLQDEIRRVRPLELVIKGAENPFAGVEEFFIKKITSLPKHDFELHSAHERLNSHFGTAALDGFGVGGMREGLRAAGALLHYVKETQRSGLSHIKKCAARLPHEYLIIDHSSRRNLEITENQRTGGREGTLLDLLDRTKTAMGARRLRSWLLNPLRHAEAVNGRLDAVSELKNDRVARSALAELLSGVYDIERLVTKVSLLSASPRDIVALKNSLSRCPDVNKRLAAFKSTLAAGINAGVDAVYEAIELIDKAVADPPPFSIKDGGVIKAGHNKLLDELREIGSGGKDWMARLEADERKRTGINSLKIGFNRVFGYYIEVTRTNLAAIPPDYTRKQTLVNAERFITPALKEWEEKILTSEEKARELEASLFAALLGDLSFYAGRIRGTAQMLSVLDALVSLADAAHELGYVRPEVAAEGGISITGGRHPVVEAVIRNSADSAGFVANDVVLDAGENQIHIVTGPNMAGKSTYLRQTALIVLMAQIGSFIPAAKASIGAVDRIFTRIGASDDLSRGQSTFMVEMSETANILNNATPMSLVILDEVGRGTSTFDGLSIAWAVVEYLHDLGGIRPMTLFATHYHELTELSLTRERVKNYNMAVKELDDKITFLRKVVPGAVNRSYGIHVARLAGIPAEVIARAGQILKNLERGEITESGMPRIALNDGGAQAQLERVEPPIPEKTDAPPLQAREGRLREELMRVDVNNITPMESLTILSRLKGMLDN